MAEDWAAANGRTLTFQYMLPVATSGPDSCTNVSPIAAAFESLATRYTIRTRLVKRSVISGDSSLLLLPAFVVRAVTPDRRRSHDSWRSSRSV